MSDSLRDSLFAKVVPTVPEINLTENSRTILSKRYLMRGEDGKPIETVNEMFFRVAYNVSKPFAEFCPDRADQAVEESTRNFYSLLTSKEFFPNSPTFTGAGTPLGQLAACFVLPIVDDMGRDPAGIMSTLRNAALIQQTGGGNGFSFSKLRQKGAFVKSSGGTSTGPVGFMSVYDQAFGMIAQGGTRRGANMAVLRVDHPDIKQFITCKSSETQITNFNISVGITDKFMAAVRDDTDFDLVAPHTKEVVETVRARELFDLIVKYAHHNGEPGVLFLDAANRYNPVPHLYELEATNPCGEQWLGPYENCCLGSINLSRHLLPNGEMDWAKLERTCRTATTFLDNVVEANAYVPHVPQLKKAAFACRRIGLGIMGLADAMYHVGARYGSPRAEEFAGQVMEFVRYHSMLTSVQLASERGHFPAIKGSIFDPQNLSWTPPTPLNGKHQVSFNRPTCDWEQVVAGIKQHGIRNACITTIAPTGTIATVAGCEGYGCEPVFALAYYRHVNDNGKDLVLTYVSPSFERALENAGITGALKEKIIEEVVATGSCQGIAEVPKEIRDVFVVSADITAKEHVRMQAAMQAFVDNSLSKTCNLPAEATEEDVAKCYMMAWELGCKGLTVYVTGSRNKVVLETKSEADKKKEEAAAAAAAASTGTPTGDEPAAQLAASNGTMGKKKPRAKMLLGCTHMINTPVGKAFVTINEDQGQPFEAFINTAKAGSETAAVSEAFGRLISYILRVASPVAPKQRLEEVMNQLVGIGGRRAMGFGRNRVLSLPDGVAQAIAGYLESTSGACLSQDLNALEKAIDSVEQTVVKPKQSKIGDLCPDCGDSALINEEGCKKCYSCGYSEC
mmetsp:Transcript_11569/g.46777  ORF Transcript_11569/g.46777 Transcript_11569/m.46777 type:complete len:849 (-) Transcript_11569:353-2899(-)|eukprot:CAMPEP_0114620102 /NCGR_PEP_ID=MMETSP0168-20121206/8548_1 /TAXON_ID=95228 ORGANISM="Vannella sp., Strain DIVA3 517/6/12" /NCGR_SAMPLE_ID=MMETSP0168 /ASSEMBLY_ACC=CAM_ASM_000044 /LENGTH=848 /DNA_ID=CAMNT_0001831275 /DNA_START=116 /DNA_END=2662 /DNA_ORIENTATION=-